MPRHIDDIKEEMNHITFIRDKEVDEKPINSVYYFTKWEFNFSTKCSILHKTYIPYFSKIMDICRKSEDLLDDTLAILPVTSSPSPFVLGIKVRQPEKIHTGRINFNKSEEYLKYLREKYKSDRFKKYNEVIEYLENILKDEVLSLLEDLYIDAETNYYG